MRTPRLCNDRLHRLAVHHRLFREYRIRCLPARSRHRRRPHHPLGSCQHYCDLADLGHEGLPPGTQPRHAHRPRRHRSVRPGHRVQRSYEQRNRREHIWRSRGQPFVHVGRHLQHRMVTSLRGVSWQGFDGRTVVPARSNCDRRGVRCAFVCGALRAIPARRTRHG